MLPVALLPAAVAPEALPAIKAPPTALFDADQTDRKPGADALKARGADDRGRAAIGRTLSTEAGRTGAAAFPPL